jgi:hypothetical protein
MAYGGANILGGGGRGKGLGDEIGPLVLARIGAANIEIGDAESLASACGIRAIGMRDGTGGELTGAGQRRQERRGVGGIQAYDGDVQVLRV